MVSFTPCLKAWQEALDVDVLCSCDVWTPPTGVIWRGDIHFTENNVTIEIHLYCSLACEGPTNDFSPFPQSFASISVSADSK